MYHYQPAHRTTAQNHLIKVTGEGEFPIQPDSASVNLGVITEGKKLIDAQQQNSIQVNKVIEALLALGINRNQIQTFDYRIESDYDYEQGKQIFRGYKITHLLQVKIEDLSIIGKVVDTGVQNGVNYVANVQFKVKNKNQYYQQALSLAINNALNKAKTIAESMGVTLYPTPVKIIEGGSEEYPIHPPVPMVKGISSTQFEPGQITVKATIIADFNYQ